MNKNKTIADLDYTFESLDLKAEVIVGELIRNGISEDTVFFKKKSNFKRRFEKDVQRIEFNNEAETNLKNVVVHVNREGLYDMLPEGIFHQDDGENQSTSGTEVIENSKKRREEEAAARRFFQPVENELLHLLCQLELEESENLNYFSAKNNKYLFHQAFGYWPEFNDIRIAKLLFFLPFK